MERLRSPVVGAAAGAVATAVMSVAMVAAERVGLMRRMPPEEISQRAVERVGERVQGREDAPRPVVDFLAPLAHLGFGVAAGALFGLLSRQLRPPVAPVLQGTFFGIAVWLVSYFGWLPALRLMPPAHRDEPGRQPAMLAAHLVYGAVLGGVAGRRR